MIGKASDFKLRLVTTEFSRCMVDIRRALRGSGKVELRDVIDSEIDRVLERAVELTGHADREKIRDRVPRRIRHVVNGKNYYIREPGTGKAWHVPDPVWMEIKRRRSEVLKRKLAAVGITKRSWLDLAPKIGFDLKVPGYVAGARVPAEHDENTATAIKGGLDSFIRMIRNSHPLLFVPATEGGQAFFSALAGRIAYFKQNVKRGVFGSVENVVKRYPGLRMKF